MLVKRLLLNISGVSGHFSFPPDFVCEQMKQKQGEGGKPRARRRPTACMAVPSEVGRVGCWHGADFHPPGTRSDALNRKAKKNAPCPLSPLFYFASASEQPGKPERARRHSKSAA